MSFGQMKISFLGTAGSKPTPERNPSCIAISYGRDVILFDCGEGCQKQMLRKVRQSRIRRVFISHFHGDHYLGLPGLMMTMSLNGRTDPIEIYGPKGTLEFIKAMLMSGYMDISYDVKVKELSSDKLQFNGYSIQSFPVDHGVPSLGFIFLEDPKRGSFDTRKARELGIEGEMFSKLENEGELILDGKTIKLEDVTQNRKKGRRVTYSGDTKPIDFPMETKGSDILIHEATFLNDEERGDTYHSTVGEACEAATHIGAKTLILTHINSRYNDIEIMERAKDRFDNVMVAEDLMEIEL